MKKVSTTEFYKKIGPLDVVFEQIAEWPYVYVWKMRHTGKIVGQSKSDETMGGPKEYFLQD